MLTDAKVWGDPEVFRPERFLGEEGQRLPNPLVLVFGFGMRYVGHYTSELPAGADVLSKRMPRHVLCGPYRLPHRGIDSFSL